MVKSVMVKVEELKEERWALPCFNTLSVYALFYRSYFSLETSQCNEKGCDGMVNRKFLIHTFVIVSALYYTFIYSVLLFLPPLIK